MCREMSCLATHGDTWNAAEGEDAMEAEVASQHSLHVPAAEPRNHVETPAGSPWEAGVEMRSLKRGGFRRETCAGGCWGSGE